MYVSYFLSLFVCVFWVHGRVCSGYVLGIFWVCSRYIFGYSTGTKIFFMKFLHKELVVNSTNLRGLPCPTSILTCTLKPYSATHTDSKPTGGEKSFAKAEQTAPPVRECAGD